MRLSRTAASMLLIGILVGTASRSAEFDDTSFRTDRGDLIRKGMSKAEVTARFRRPDERDVISTGADCQIKIEVWNFYLEDRVLIITFTGNEASNIKLIRLR